MVDTGAQYVPVIQQSILFLAVWFSPPWSVWGKMCNQNTHFRLLMPNPWQSQGQALRGGWLCSDTMVMRAWTTLPRLRWRNIWAQFGALTIIHIQWWRAKTTLEPFLEPSDGTIRWNHQIEPYGTTWINHQHQRCRGCTFRWLPALGAPWVAKHR